MSDTIILEGEMSLSQIIDGDVDLTLVEDGESGIFMPILPILQENKTATPIEQAQIITPDPQYNGLRKVTVNAIPSDYVGSAIVHDPAITVNGASVNVPSGYHTEDKIATVQTAQQATPAINVNGTNITASSVQLEGYVTAGTKTATATVPSGSVIVNDKAITANPTISVGNDGKITASVSASSIVSPTVSEGYVTGGISGTITVSGQNTTQLTTQPGTTITPTESQQTAVASGKYTTGAVKVGAIPSNYVGSGIVHDPTPTVSGATVNIPTGYYSQNTSESVLTTQQATPVITVNGGNITATATQGEGYVQAGTETATEQLPTMAGQTVTPSTSSQTVATQGKYMTGNVTVTAMPTGTAGTPTATKGAVVNNSVTVTPSVINSAGYISGGTITGAGISVSANELVSGTLSVTQNGIADVTNYANIDVNVAVGGAVKMGVIRPDAELIQKWTYDKWLVADEGITLPSTYSTTAQTLKESANIATYDGTPSTYRYFITQRCLTIPTYNIATLAKGREEYVYSVYGGEWVYQPQGELCTLDGTKTYGQYSQMTSTGAFTREVLWNSATALNVYTSPAYCLAQNLQAPAIGSNRTITIKSPTVTIRGHTTYLTKTFYEAITDARLQYVIELWRVPVDDVIGWITGSQMRSLYDDIANNGGTLR